MASIEPTEELLERAWRELYPDAGPLADARRAYARYSLARARAIALANARTPPPALATPAPPPAPPSEAPAWWGGLKVTHSEPLHDRKSAAAGERDDD
jgi:hypothetical protein